MGVLFRLAHVTIALNTPCLNPAREIRFPLWARSRQSIVVLTIRTV
jgi:hypothetical protein